MKEMMQMMSVFPLMSEEDQREGLEMLRRIFDDPVPANKRAGGAVVDISSHPAWRR